MSTYYEILQISSDATVAEIETACEGQYNHWRRLVTHHDPEMVNKANQALQWLETMRATLTDPAKREEYDASIGLRGPVGGLADPQARTGIAVPTPPPPRPRSGPQSSPAPATGERVDAWVCPQCQAASPVGTQFCKKCGHTLGRPCPKCGELIEATADFCSQCGVDIEAFIAEQERLAEEQRRREQAEAQQRAEEARRQAEEQARRKAKEREQMRRVRIVTGCVIAVFVVIGIAWAIVAGVIEAVEQRQYRIQATATAEQHQANVTATAERQQAQATAAVQAVISTGGTVDNRGTVRDSYGIPIVYVPGGSFMMGSTDGDSDEQPVHTVTLDDFWIYQTEVGNEQYARCVADGECRDSAYKADVLWDYSRDDYPVVGVSWNDASSYCEWAGARLPTEAEWEYAARGPENYVYPWGNDDSIRGRAQFDVCSGRTMSVDSFPNGASWCGALNMAGNVWEWTADWYDNYPSEPQVNPTGPETGIDKVVRGGGWRSSWRRLRTAYRGADDPNNSDNSSGFRCVSDAPGQ